VIQSESSEPLPNPDADRWNARYSQEREFWLERDPKQLLIDHDSLLPKSGLALDAASGVAINGLYLARRGLHVIALDISEYALQLARERSQQIESLPLDAAVVDLSVNPWLPPKRFDVILNFHFIERAILPVYDSALKPGGVIFFESFVKMDNNPDNPVYYLEPGELLKFYQHYETIFYKEIRQSPSSRHPERGLAQMVARKR
jgi:tellurite methyltransferase